MITQLRKKLSGTFTHIFIFIAIFGLLGLFSLPMIIKQGSKPWVFKINDRIVTQTQFEQEVSLQTDRIAMFKEQYGQFADMLFQSMGMSTDPKILATDLITKKSLLDHAAYHAHIRVAETYANQKIADQQFCANYLSEVVPPFFYDKDGNLQTALLRLYLQKWGLSSSAFLTKAQDGIARQLITNLVNHSAYVPAYEQELFLLNQHGSKKIEFIVLNRKDFVEKIKKNAPSLEILEQYFNEKNKTAQTYFVPEKRDVTVWTFDPSLYNASITNEQLLDYYNKNKSQKFVAQQAEATVRKLVYKEQPINGPSIATLREELVENPSLFVEYVKKYSQDEASIKKGGLIDPLVHGTSNAPLYKAAFALKEVGSVSPVISVDDSFVILQLVNKKPKKYKEFDAVKNDITLLLKKQQFKNSFSKELRKALKDGVVDTKELDSLVRMHGATKKIVKGVTHQQKNAVSQAAFSIEKKGKAQITSLDNNNEVNLIMLDAIIPKYLPDFNAIVDTVKNDWYELQGALALQKAYTDIQEKLSQNSLKEVAAIFNLPLKSIIFKGAHDKNAIKNLEQYGIPYDDLVNIEKQNSFCFSMTTDHAFFAHCISCEKDNDHISLSPEEQDALEKATKQLIIEGLIASLHRDAKIETNESFTTPLEDYIV